MVHAIEWVPNSASYNMEKLNLEVLQEEQWQDTFCIKKVKALKIKQDHSLMLDNNSVLQENGYTEVYYRAYDCCAQNVNISYHCRVPQW